MQLQLEAAASGKASVVLRVDHLIFLDDNIVLVPERLNGVQGFFRCLCSEAFDQRVFMRDHAALEAIVSACFATFAFLRL